MINMAIWLVRAGKSGSYENKFLTTSRIYLTWDDLNVNLASLENKDALTEKLLDTYPDVKRNTIRNWVGQIYPIAHRMKKGDWVVLPSKLSSVIHFGEIVGDYEFEPKAVNPFYHYRKVKWFKKGVPRSQFDQDLLYSFGAFMTICEIKRNNAEERLRKMLSGHEVKSFRQNNTDSYATDSDSTIELEEIANDQIASLLISKFKGSKMEYVVESILKAKGYTTYRSPEGADKGIDILAAPAPMGFGSPRICVQVKTSSNPTDRPTLDQLVGTMQNINAEQGILVSWGGFKNSVERERANHFFRIRFWGQKELIDEFQREYDKLPEDIRSEVPLKRIWTVSLSE